MSQGGSPKLSNGSRRKGPVLIEREKIRLSDGQEMPKSPQNGGFEPKFSPLGPKFRTRAWRVAPCRRSAAP
eukprot:scaffold90296_cov68-Phaeocystis_antarctica.AAC.14